ncbi:hypothetical protein EVG20_g10125 [Dentipellis fragilis]|uniref:Uncharacterized protein n=1 Tax=Dentipellis fragilis TaxID=205917 RepID=A0A4Y9XTG6_9AGAM|nr:hypothetical protein EVG20_g10125 [Dentipellis fragilis]
MPDTLSIISYLLYLVQDYKVHILFPYPFKMSSQHGKHGTIHCGSPILSPMSQAYQYLPPIRTFEDDSTPLSTQPCAPLSPALESTPGADVDPLQPVDAVRTGSNLTETPYDYVPGTNTVRQAVCDGHLCGNTSDEFPSLHTLLNSAPGDPRSSPGPAAESSVAPATACKPSMGRKACQDIPLQALIPLAEAYLKFNPAGARHGEVTKTWERVAENKMKALMAYHENPDGSSGATVRKQLSGTSIAIQLGALLDRACEMARVAKDATEEQREQNRQHAEWDRRGGEALRTASMQVRGSKQKLRELTPDSDSGESGSETDAGAHCDGDEVSTPNDGTTLKPHGPAAAAKAHHLDAASSSQLPPLDNHSNEIVTLLRESNKRQKDFHDMVMDTMKEGTRVYQESSNRLLEGFLAASKEMAKDV